MAQREEEAVEVALGVVPKKLIRKLVYNYWFKAVKVPQYPT